MGHFTLHMRKYSNDMLLNEELYFEEYLAGLGMNPQAIYGAPLYCYLLRLGGGKKPITLLTCDEEAWGDGCSIRSTMHSQICWLFVTSRFSQRRFSLLRF